ncbi:hypothetical protein J6590_056311 [Homalodisca vitripennis]|nr:hypothetical protein J6590_056311 [Homalodisca vitripennis]
MSDFVATDRGASGATAPGRGRQGGGGRMIKWREAAPSTHITAAQCLCVSQSVIDLG